MKKVLWFSRHKMTDEQRKALEQSLGQIKVTQVNGSAPNVHVPFEGKEPEKSNGVDAEKVLTGELPPLKELIESFDEAAVVLPINMLQQLLPFAAKGRLLQSVSERRSGEDGKAIFVHKKWQSVIEVKIVTEDL